MQRLAALSYQVAFLNLQQSTVRHECPQGCGARILTRIAAIRHSERSEESPSMPQSVAEGEIFAALRMTTGDSQYESRPSISGTANCNDCNFVSESGQIFRLWKTNVLFGLGRFRHVDLRLHRPEFRQSCGSVGRILAAGIARDQRLVRVGSLVSFA